MGVDDYGDGEMEFSHCQFCGVPSASHTDEADDLLGSAFARATVERSQRRNEENASSGIEEISHIKEIKLKPCARCRTVAYCCRECQRADYKDHKKICRRIGEERIRLKQVRSDGGQEDERPIDKTTSLPIKGIPSPTKNPRTSYQSDINPASLEEEEMVVLHCDSPESPADGLTGVFSKVPDAVEMRVYELNDSMTRRLMAGQIADCSNLNAAGLFIDFQRVIGLQVYLLQYSDGSLAVVLNTGEVCFREVKLARSRDVKFWKDPASLLHLQGSDIYSTWIEEESRGTLVERPATKMAITALDTIVEAARLSKLTKIPCPQIYQEAPDIQLWDRTMVLLFDHRTCSVPCEWMDAIAGLFIPTGAVQNGYPIYARQSTIELIKSLPLSGLSYLEKYGIRLDTKGTFQQTRQLKLSVRTDSVLAIHQVMEATHVPANALALLTDPNELFTSTAKSFSTWRVNYKGRWFHVHVLFVPLESIRRAVSLAELEDAMANEVAASDVSNVQSEVKSKKKKRKKKKKKDLPAEMAPKGSESTVVSAETSEEVGAVPYSKDSAEPDNKSMRKGSGDCDRGAASQKTKSAETDLLLLMKSRIASVLKLDEDRLPSSAMPILSACDTDLESWGATNVLDSLLGCAVDPAPWLQLDEAVTSKVIKDAGADVAEWMKSNGSRLVSLFSNNSRYSDLESLLGFELVVSAKSVVHLLAWIEENTFNRTDDLACYDFAELCLSEFKAEYPDVEYPIKYCSGNPDLTCQLDWVVDNPADLGDEECNKFKDYCQRQLVLNHTRYVWPIANVIVDDIMPGYW